MILGDRRVSALVLALSAFSSCLPFTTSVGVYNLYAVLNVTEQSSHDEISLSATRILSKGSDATEADSPLSWQTEIQVLHARDVLTCPQTRILFDTFGVDPLRKTVMSIFENDQAEERERHSDEPPWPPLHPEEIPSESVELDASTIESVVLHSNKAWLIQLYSSYDPQSKEFAAHWEDAGYALDGITALGRIDVLHSVQLAASLAHKPAGLPLVYGKSPTCSSLACLVRYRGEYLGSDRVQEFAVERVLRIPAVKIYSLHNLINSYFKQVPEHKVRFLYLMDRGEVVPPPGLRYVAAHFWRHSVWGAIPFFPHHQHVYHKWWKIEGPPALAIYKDPLTDPIVYPGPLNTSFLLHLAESHKSFDIPQIRSVSVSAMGCDPYGYPRQGRSTSKQTWYCAVLVGMSGPALGKARKAFLDFQMLLQQGKLHGGDSKAMASTQAVWDDKRLTLAWLDGLKQQKYCGFLLGWESALYCSRHMDGSQVGLSMQVFQRPPHAHVAGQHSQLAYTYVSQYKGNISNITEVMEWMEQSISTAEPFDFPFNVMKPPPLVPEDSISTFDRVKSLLAIGSERMVHALAAKMDHIPALPFLPPSSVRSHGSLPPGPGAGTPPKSTWLRSILLTAAFGWFGYVYLSWRRRGAVVVTK